MKVSSSLFARLGLMAYVYFFLSPSIFANPETKDMRSLQGTDGTFHVIMTHGDTAIGDPIITKVEKLQHASTMSEPRPSVSLSEEKIACTPEYQEIPGHTMCLQNRPDILSRGVDKSTADAIVRLHNEYRATVTPAATDMVSMQWDDRLAAVAQQWANQCKMSHDKTKQRSIPEYGLKIGQNVAGGFSDWRQCIKAWHDEVRMYRYGLDPSSYLGKGGWSKIGHYTQMVQNTTSLVGCGFAECRHTQYGHYFVCNYATAQSHMDVPYTLGPRCAACPNTCNHGLCDCAGKTCLNGGTLIPNTCTCSCLPVYKGSVCGEVNCPNSEPFFCGRNLLKPDCEKYDNVPSMCPYMCDICKKQSTSQMQLWTNNIGSPLPFRSEFGCEYRGKRSSPEECKMYGDHGNDLKFCGSMGGDIDCGDCDNFYNIKKDYCPVMCGLCGSPCDGKRCLNGGRLDTDTCSCTCNKPYVGNTCEKADCPESDPFHCMLYPLSHCIDFVNVPGLCPHLCGIC